MDSIFTNYRIQSNSNNEITVLLASEALLGALKSAAASSANSATFDSDDAVVKLAKKDEHAVLTFEISGQTRVGHKLRVSHDVKIEVMRPTDVEKLKEPLCPEPDVCDISSMRLVANQVNRFIFSFRPCRSSVR